MKHLLTWLLLLMSMNTFSKTDDFLSVEKAFPYMVDINGTSLTVNWKISDGYYLYLSRLKAVQHGKILALSTVKTPISKQDEFFGKINIFKHQLDATFELIDDSAITLTFQGCAEQGLCYPPVYSEFNVTPQTELKAYSEPEKSNSNSLLDKNSVPWTLFLFFILGVGLAFTPCVFPMFPILSAIIVGQGKYISTLKAFYLSLCYVLGMAFTYTIAGVLVGYFGATANVQLYLQTPWVLALFSSIFVVLAFSMFGFFELSLPRFLQEKLQSKHTEQPSKKAVSIFVMGGISALVVSPCVSAPLAGVLTYISTTGDAFLGGFALLFLALGMGVPLLVIGTGGSRFLPKSGPWMLHIKSVFGVALLAVAIWLIERIVSAQITLMLWATLLIISSVYLGAFDLAKTGWSKFTRGLGLLFFLYGIILLVTVSFGMETLTQPFNESFSLTALSDKEIINAKKTPYERQVTTKIELEKALKDAQVSHKIMLLDVYADWCVSCKIMEKEIFNQPEVQQALTNFMFVQFDISKNTPEQLKLLERFQIFGPPAVLAFKDGLHMKEKNLIGEFSKEDFLNTLNRQF